MFAAVRPRRNPRNAALAAGVALAAASALLVVQRTSSDIGLARDAAAAVGGPIASAGATVNDGVSRAWSGLFAADGLRAENEALRQELAALRLESAASAARVQELGAAVIVGESLPEVAPAAMTARVLGPVPDGAARRIWIDAGAEDALQVGQTVVGPQGVLGRVHAVHGSRAIVQLLSDASSRWGGEIAARGERGVVQGTGREGRLILRLETTAAEVAEGDVVVTSGAAGSALPAGLPLGTVAEVAVGDEGERHAVVEPAGTAEGLRHVFVLDERQIPWEPGS